MPTPGAPAAYDSIYNQIVANEQNKLANAQRVYGAYNPATGQYTTGTAQSGLSREYGFGDEGAANEFSRLGVLNRQSKMDLTDQMNQAAERGNFGSGGYSIRRNNMLWDQSAALNSLKSDYDKQIFGLGQQAFQAQSDYDSARSSAWGDLVLRKLADAENNPGPTEGGGGGGGGGSAPTASAVSKPIKKTIIDGIDWTSAEKTYSGGTWAPKVHGDGSRYYRSPNGTLYKVWPNGYREVKK